MSNAMIIAQSYYDNGNYVEAAEIYIKWAEKSGVAAYNLAYMYSVGNGVPMCRTTSDKYYFIEGLFKHMADTASNKTSCISIA